MAKVLLIGEPIALLIAETVGPLEEVERFTRKLAGAEVNVCFGLARLGHDVDFITRLGHDPFGYYTKNTLEQEGIDTKLIVFDDAYLTGSMLKGKVLEGDPPIAFYTKGSAATHITPEMIEKVDLTGLDWIHVTGVLPAISETARQATKRLMARGREAGIPLSFDPNLRPTLWGDDELMMKWINDLSQLADIVLPGLEEGLILTGFDTPEKIADFYQALGVKQVVVKLGSDGAYVRDGDQSQSIPGFKVDTIIDTVGAGDGFATGVVSGLVEGLSLTDAVVRGNAIGSMQIQHVSDNEALPTRKELQDYLEART
ncbi:MAG: sugar kinase [Turicibacter sp.]|nr:sugar kinase [Turicibacter sp.]